MIKSKRTVIAVFGILVIWSFAGMYAAITTQLVKFDLEPAYTGIAAIRVFDGATTNPTVTFSDSYQGTYNVSEAGTQATKSNYANFESLTEKTGGAIQYTVAGLGDQKITVHSGTSGYNSDTLYVKVSNPRKEDGLVAEGTLGTLDVLGEEIDYMRKFSISQGSYAAKSIIRDIPGTDTYTGTAALTIESQVLLPGAKIFYGFSGDPGVTTIGVTYTILAEGGTTSAMF